MLEARDHGDPEDAAVLNSVHLAFCPKYVLAFAGTTPDGKPLRRVLIGGRRFHDDHPLLVDPDSCRVSVLDYSFDFSLCTTSSVTREAIYRIEIIKAKLHLCRIGLPDFRVESLLTPVPLGECVKYGDKFLIIGGRWWVIDLKEEPENRIREIADRQPWCYGTGPGPGSEFVDGDTRPHFEKYDYEYNRVGRKQRLWAESSSGAATNIRPSGRPTRSPSTASRCWATTSISVSFVSGSAARRRNLSGRSSP